MKFIRNIFALIGLITVVIAVGGYAAVKPILDEFDPRFLEVQGEFMQKLLETKDPGVAMMWTFPVNEGLSADDVIDSLKSVATERNFLFVGESPFYKQVKAITGEDYRYVNFLSFCDARVGMMMLEYKDQYSGFMPCRIALVEDREGKLWLHSMNLDLMIYGGKKLPDDLKQEALRVRKNLLDMMDRAAKGDF